MNAFSYTNLETRDFWIISNDSYESVFMNTRRRNFSNEIHRVGLWHSAYRARKLESLAEMSREMYHGRLLGVPNSVALNR